MFKRERVFYASANLLNLSISCSLFDSLTCSFSVLFDAKSGNIRKKIANFSKRFTLIRDKASAKNHAMWSDISEQCLPNKNTAQPVAYSSLSFKEYLV